MCFSWGLSEKHLMCRLKVAQVYVKHIWVVINLQDNDIRFLLLKEVHSEFNDPQITSVWCTYYQEYQKFLSNLEILHIDLK